MTFNYIIWNIDPEIFSLFGKLSIRWYGLLFALSFYLGYVICSKFFKKEKVPIELLDKLTIYMALGTIIGARLGHCFFYDADYYLSNPIEIFKIWEGGLASHGAAIGILIALYLFARKTKKSTLWIVDRIVIVVALAGFFIRMGNLMNSEIHGVATEKKHGYIYTRSFTRYFDNNDQIKKIKFNRVENDSIIQDKFIPITMNVEFEKTLRDTNKIKAMLNYEINQHLVRDLKNDEENIFYPPDKKFAYQLFQKNRNYIASITVLGVPKYPTQIYEALAYLLIFLMLLSMYYKNNGKLYGGLLFGLFLMTVFTARFIIEIVKENQEAFEESLKFNMGQLLSVPFIFIGFAFFIYAIRTRRLL